MCMCNRSDPCWARGHSHGFSALSIYAHQASLAAANWGVLTVFFHTHASKCSVLKTARTSLLGPHTSLTLPCLRFHWRFHIFLVDPLHAPLYLKIWWRLSVLRTGLLEKISHKSLLSDKQRLVHQNLCCRYKSLFYLDKEKHKKAIILNILGCELRGDERLPCDYNQEKTDSAQSSSNKCKNYLLEVYPQHGNFFNAI